MKPRTVVALGAFVLITNVVIAQIADLEPNDVPVWDALELYRDDPICLRSVEARELTVLPGISLRTAHRVIKIVAASALDCTIEQVADSACLSIEQLIILATCTTLDCRARPFIHSAWARFRQRDGRTLIRSDVVSDAGRVGGVFDAAPVPPTTASDDAPESEVTKSAWLSVKLWNTTAHLGSMRAGAGMGLLLGGAGRFGSSISARSGSNPDAPSIRAHTSSYLGGALRGVGIQHADSTWTAIAGVSEIATGREERAVYGAFQCSLDPSLLNSVIKSRALQLKRLDVGLALLRLNYNAPSESRAANVVKSDALTSGSLFSTLSLDGMDVRAEVAIDNTTASAITLAAHSIVHGREPRWSTGLRYFSADYHAPYAASISDASYISNEYGAYLASEIRLSAWRLNAALDIHGSLAPRYGSPLPTRGFDLQLMAVTQSIDLRARYERDTEGWRPPEEAFTQMHTRSRLSLRAETAMQVNRNLRVRGRIDLRHAIFTSARESEQGWASFVDAQWQATPWLSVRARFTLFNSESIDVAPYYLETDALGSTRTVACSGQGSRMHLALRLNIVSFATITGTVVQEYRTTSPPRPVSGLLQIDLRLPS